MYLERMSLDEVIYYLNKKTYLHGINWCLKVLKGKKIKIWH